MRFNSGSSIKNNAYSASSASVDTNEKLKKLNEELDQLELLVSSMQTSLSNVNSKVGTNPVADQIAAVKTEIENAIGQEVTTQQVTATEADIDTIISNILRTDSITPKEGSSVVFSSNIEVPSVKISDAITSVANNNDIRVPENAIAWIGSNLVINKGNGNSLIFSKNGDISYSISDNNILINANDSVNVSYIYRDSPVDVVAHEAASYTSVNSGLTVVGPFYADLTAATFQNITVSNTLTAKKINAENIAVSEDVEVTGTVAADKIEANDAEIEEIESETISTDRINSSQIHTKVNKENIGYTIIQEHQNTEEYAVGIPITNGIWEVELENYFKATIDKTHSAGIVTYWRASESSLPQIGIKDDVLYLYTRKSGKLYFSNNILEVNDATVSIHAPNDPGYPVIETLDKQIDLISNNGVVATDTMIVDDIVINGDYDSTFNDIYIKDDIYLEDEDEYGAKHWHKGTPNQVIRVDETSEEPTWQDTVITTHGGAIQARNELITEGTLATYNGTVGDVQYRSKTDTIQDLYEEFDEQTSNWYKTPALQEKVTDITSYKETPGNLQFIIHTESGKSILFEHEPLDEIEVNGLYQVTSDTTMPAYLLIIYLTSSLDYSTKLFQQGTLQIKDSNGKWQTIIGLAEVPDIYLFNEKFSNGRNLWTTKTNKKALSIPVARNGYASGTIQYAVVDANKKLVLLENLVSTLNQEMGQDIHLNYPSWWNEIELPNVTHNEIRYVEGSGVITNFGTTENPDYGDIRSVSQADSNVLEFTFVRDSGSTYTQEDWDNATPVRLTGLDISILHTEVNYPYDKVVNTNTRKTSYYFHANDNNNVEIKDINVYKKDIAIDARLINKSSPGTSPVQASPECYEDIKFVYSVVSSMLGPVYFLRGKDGKYYQTGNIYVDSDYAWYVRGPVEITEEEYNTNSGIPGDTYTLELYKPVFWSNLLWDNTEVKTQIINWMGAAAISSEVLNALTLRDYSNIAAYVTEMNKAYINTIYSIFFDNGTVDYVYGEDTEYSVYIPVENPMVWTEVPLSALELYQTYDQNVFYLEEDKDSKITDVTPSDTEYTYTAYEDSEHTEPGVQNTAIGSDEIQWYSSDDIEHENPIVGPFDSFVRYLATDPNCTVQFAVGEYKYVVIDSIDAGTFTVTTSQGDETVEYNDAVTVYTLAETYVDNYPITHLGNGTQVHGSISAESLDANTIKNRYFYVGDTLTPAELAEFEDNALIIMGD